MNGWASAVEAAEQKQLIADLKEARAQLIARGWCRGDFLAPDGSVCALGAVRTAIDPTYNRGYWNSVIDMAGGRYVNAQRALEDHLPVTSGRCAVGRCGHVDCFNDRAASDAQDVLDLFDKTLADLGGLA